MNTTFFTNPWAFSLCLALTLVFAMAPDLALAFATPSPTGSATAISDVLCSVVEWFTGPVGKGIATLAIIIIGVGALMGKVSWGMAIIVGVGVAVIFGAESLVTDLGHGSSC